jgi:NAD(P)-dependent dehydrogenase (short-subunit alcohol dehydrogenase family)
MWERIVGINLTGTFLCTRAVIDEMLSAKWGRIVNVASIAGLYGAPYISAYTASKHGVIGLTRALAAELDGTGVTVNAICPGYTDTGMMDQAIENIVRRTGMSAKEARAQLAQTNPGGRIVAVDEVAQAALSLSESDENGREIVLPAP